MSNNNDRFLSAYNRLDNYLQSIVKTKGHVNMIWYLEQISPEKQRSELKTIRLYKNSVESHGVNHADKKPIVPEEWIHFLLDELEWCKRNRDIITPKLQSLLDSKKSVTHKKSTPKSPNNVPPKKRTKAPTFYVIYIVQKDGTTGYFRKLFGNIKKYAFVSDTLDSPGVQQYPTYNAANYMAKQIRAQCSDLHISIVSVKS